LANGVMVTNQHMEVVLLNPALKKLMGLAGEIKTPAPLTPLIQDQSLIETIQGILSQPSSGEDDFVSQEISIENKTLRAISAPVLGPDQKAAGSVTVIEDVTVFKQISQMKSDLVNMVAHELRSPLISIKQLINVLLEGLCGTLAEKQQDYLTRATKKIDELMELIRDLLDIAKIESGMVFQQQVPTDLDELIKNTIETMDVRAKKQGVVLACSCQNPRLVLADPLEMEKAFNNLIDNAIKYSPDGGQVTIAITGRDDVMEVKVSDTGIGIDPGELPKIFNKYYRVKHPKTRQVIGTGLGLSLVKGIVEAHQGQIEVESVPDQGTTFRVTLPAIKEGEAGRPNGD